MKDVKFLEEIANILIKYQVTRVKLNLMNFKKNILKIDAGYIGLVSASSKSHQW